MTDKEELTENKIESTKEIENKAEENGSNEDIMRAAALAYAKYLKEHGLVPGEAAAEEKDSESIDKEDSAVKSEADSEADPNNESQKKQRLRKMEKEFLAGGAKKDPLAAGVNLHDRIQDKIDTVLTDLGKDFARGTHNITSTYQNTRRNIGRGILIIGLLAAVMLVVFDRVTVYEYAYNGKILGYVKEQEDVTEVLDVAGRKLTGNTDTGAKVEFVPNQNVTFDLVVGRGKSTDDADAVVNKLIYMTDIETEAYGIYDGSQLKAIVKDQEDAERLLQETKAELSTPDSGMRLVSSDFINPLEIKPLNVLLESVQSNVAARRQMIEGGKMEVFHIVDSTDIDNPDISETDSEDEVQNKMIAMLAETFGVEVEDLYDEDNNDIISTVEPGDIVCIRTEVEPVDVEMVESGRVKEVIEYKTIKKDSDEYYQGDTYIQQEGSNGSRIFEGTITKVAGVEVDRDAISEEITKEPKDKIILIGTKERPKTAPTGTFQMPIKNYTVTSEYGGRWGRMHDGIDLGSPTGTMIYAADGGTIIRASYYGGYGNCVEVDHENGLVTRYAHCSKLLVNVGDKVYQGQEIALVGNTGNSFGSHLHFEVRVNGASQNPRNYINP